MTLHLRSVTVAVAATLTVLALAHPRGQGDDTGGACVPDSERAGRSFGCFILAAQPVGQLSSVTAFWHVETFPNRAAAEQARGLRGTVLEVFGKVWLLSIAEAGWRSPGGTHVDEIGPLPTKPNTAYTAQYMEAVFRPGMKSRVHRHSGAEAWYTVTGETCLETPQGRVVDTVANSRHVVVPEGPPMELTAIGSEVRRSLVLILHDAGQPHTSVVTDWTPKGLCK